MSATGRGSGGDRSGPPSGRRRGLRPPEAPGTDGLVGNRPSRPDGDSHPGRGARRHKRTPTGDRTSRTRHDTSTGRTRPGPGRPTRGRDSGNSPPPRPDRDAPTAPPGRVPGMRRLPSENQKRAGQGGKGNPDRTGRPPTQTAPGSRRTEGSVVNPLPELPHVLVPALILRVSEAGKRRTEPPLQDHLGPAPSQQQERPRVPPAPPRGVEGGEAPDRATLPSGISVRRPAEETSSNGPPLRVAHTRGRWSPDRVPQPVARSGDQPTPTQTSPAAARALLSRHGRQASDRVRAASVRRRTTGKPPRAPHRPQTRGGDGRRRTRPETPPTESRSGAGHHEGARREHP